MAITSPIKEYVVTGIKSLKFYDSTGKYVGKIDKLNDLSISDETASSELRGGLNNGVILKLYGDRTVTLNANNAVFSDDMMQIMTGNIKTTKTINRPAEDIKLTISANTATLSKTPSGTGDMSIFLSNANGEDITRLTKVASAPTTGQYSITGSTVTLASGTTGYLNAYYFESVEQEVIEAMANSYPIYRAIGECLATSTSNKKVYFCNIDMPNVQISPSITISTKNSSDAPDPNPISLDLLSINTYPYALQFVEQ